MIEYQAEGVEMPSINLEHISQWLVRVAARYDYRIGDLCYRFTNDEQILECNRQFLNHDYYTDIITFDYTEDDVINGDMLISLDTVRSNAEELGESYDRELLRVIVHGVLHLCGLNDKGPGEREQMEAAEDEALLML
ncbi:MAG: rRNA maturation RNase YbeY [Muribaculaceae bacterium]|nr:rRNA maturation RNase YbeY [Muribaculaceae bacterium]MDE6295665.1 rRNA maturation RNase YbeY [Muribaculaceae bacterium]